MPQVLSAGTYYIDAHSVSGAAATAGFTINVAQTSTLAVSAISPTSGGAGYDVTIEIDGENFSPTMTARLVQGANHDHRVEHRLRGASQVFATFDLSHVNQELNPVSYTVNVTQGGQTVSAPKSFQVTAATRDCCRSHRQ